MGHNDLLNTGLVLGLGLSSSSPTTIELKSQNLDRKFSEPSLTLSLSGETYDQVHALKSAGNNNDHDELLYGQDSPKSSSLISNVSTVKRERENISDEDDDDDGSNGRKKLRLTKAQSALLEQSFKLHSTLNPKEKQELARELKLRPRQVEVWFQNRRARTKLKQTEVDCEFLKKWCETLTDENRRLQKELHELKSAQPAAAAALTMCPSCESIGGGVTQNAAKSHFIIMAPKPHFFNPFTNPSAAC